MKTGVEKIIGLGYCGFFQSSARPQGTGPEARSVEKEIKGF
jgi:hypothetical protein